MKTRHQLNKKQFGVCNWALKGDKKRRKLLEKLGHLLIEQNKVDAALACFNELPGPIRKIGSCERFYQPWVTWELTRPSLLRPMRTVSKPTSVNLRIGYMRDLAQHLLDRMHRPDEACGWYEQIIEYDSSDRRALEALAATYRETASYSSEERILSQLIDPQRTGRRP